MRAVTSHPQLNFLNCSNNTEQHRTQNTEHSHKQGPLDQEGTSVARVESDEQGKMSSNNNGYVYVMLGAASILYNQL